MLMRSRLAVFGPRRARVEIIPLIDVVFFLLSTFVLFTFTMRSTHALDVVLPRSGPPSPQENVVLQLTDDGAAYWNQERLSVAELPARLAAYRQASVNPRVVIAGDEKARWGPVIAAVDAVRQAGIKDFTIETHTRPTGR